MKTTRFGTAFLGLLALPATACAGDRPAGLFGANSYWTGLVDYWQGVFQQQNGIAMGITVVGLIALFIITRGKWLK
jgi:hypothetical protein